MRWTWWLVVGLAVGATGVVVAAAETGVREPGSMTRQTRVSIAGESFWINGQPTYAGRTWRGHKIEGLLLNSRMVQGTFDDLNPETRVRWAYPDGPWDALEVVRLDEKDGRAPTTDMSGNPLNTRGYPLTTSSDAHHPEHVARRAFDLDVGNDPLLDAEGHVRIDTIRAALTRRIPS